MILAVISLLVAHHEVDNGVNVPLLGEVVASLGNGEGALLLRRVRRVHGLPGQ